MPIPTGSQNGRLMSPDTPAPPAPRAETRQARPRRLLAGAALVGAAAVWWAAAGTGEEVEMVRPAAGVTAVEIDLSAGAIRFEVGERVLVEVTSRSGPFGRTPSVTSEVADGVLQLSGTCPRLGVGRCATDVTVTLPPTGTVDVASGAGSIEGVVAGGSVRAFTGAGPVTLTATEDIDAISVSTGAGSIDLSVPDLAYAVTTHTGVGRTRVEVETAADARRTIEARSGAGSVTVRPAEDVHAQRETPA
jgi:hypothetical protein